MEKCRRSIELSARVDDRGPMQLTYSKMHSKSSVLKEFMADWNILELQ
jgi:hypothetical protein